MYFLIFWENIIIRLIFAQLHAKGSSLIFWSSGTVKIPKTFPSTSIILNGDKKGQKELITYLRNMAMHGKNPVEKHKGSSVYSIESLRQLFQALKTLEEFTYRVEKLIHEHKDYQKLVELDNQKKLEIIHQHHPQALNYFIGNH